MSIPSSSELVATRHGSSPAFSSSSTFVRSSRASEPWCARAISAGADPSARPPSSCAASSFRRSATRSAERRLLTKTIVEWCSRTSSQQLRVDRRPDRALVASPAGSAGSPRRIGCRPGGVRREPGSVIDSTGTSMRRSSGLRWPPASTIVTSPAGADEEAADLLERALRGAQADPLDHRPRARSPSAARSRHAASARLRLQALERERQVRAALGVGDGVDLVDDHRLHAAEHLARARGEDQVQRLGRRDEDVRRVAQPSRRARAGACRRCGSPRARPRRRSRAAARAGCARCRTRAPSAGSRTPRGAAAPPWTIPAAAPSSPPLVPPLAPPD